MAWIGLLLVTLIFYTPYIGLGEEIINSADSIIIVYMGIPFSIIGPIKLFTYSFLTWFVFWGGSMFLERVLKIDFLRKFRLRNDLVYASLPSISMQIVVRLAQIIIALVILKLIIRALFMILSVALLPWVIGQFSPIIASIVKSTISNWATALIQFGFEDIVGVFSFLILFINRFYLWEKRYRYNLDIIRNQQKRKHDQSDIVIPVTQI